MRILLYPKPEQPHEGQPDQEDPPQFNDRFGDDSDHKPDNLKDGLADLFQYGPTFSGKMSPLKACLTVLVGMLFAGSFPSWC